MTTTVYLLHFVSPISPNSPARHYLGCSGNLPKRLATQRKGHGSRFCQVAKERGIDFLVARTWPGDRKLERKLKEYRNSPRFCPICRAERKKRNAKK